MSDHTRKLLNAAQDLHPKRIDALYGLEPVYDPAVPDIVGSSAQEFAELQCPYCGEVMGSMIDLTAGSRSFIEDCQVCCCAMEVHVECAERGGLQALRTERSD